MKKFFLGILLLCVIGGVVAYRGNNDPGAIIKRITRQGIPRNGALHYRVHLFGIIPAGEAVFEPVRDEEYDGRAVYHLNAHARTHPFLSAFFSGSASFDSYIDTVRFLPLEFKQRIALRGKPERSKTVYYDQAQHVMTIAGERRQIHPGTHDDLSVIFALRHMRFDDGGSFSLNLNTNQKNYSIEGGVVRYSLKQGPLILPLLRLSANIFRRDKNPYHRSQMTMVLWPEHENMPLIINAVASGVLVNATLVTIE